MGRHSSIPNLIDETKVITIKKLKEWSYLKPNTHKSGTITWSRHGEVYSTIGIEVSTIHNYIELDYTYRQTTKENYRVQLVQISSNLGKGEIWLFQCPETNKLCRKLYFSHGKFLHREAAKGYIYEKQTYSKRFRALTQLYASDSDFEKVLSKRLRKYYRGKPTKRYKKLLRLEYIAQNYNEAIEIQLFN